MPNPVRVASSCWVSPRRLRAATMSSGASRPLCRQTAACSATTASAGRAANPQVPHVATRTTAVAMCSAPERSRYGTWVRLRDHVTAGAPHAWQCVSAWSFMGLGARMETDEDQRADRRAREREDPLDVDSWGSKSSRNNQDEHRAGRIAVPRLLACFDARRNPARMPPPIPQQLSDAPANKLHRLWPGEVRRAAVARVLGIRGMPPRAHGRIGDPPLRRGTVRKEVIGTNPWIVARHVEAECRSAGGNGMCSKRKRRTKSII